jgi:glyoxylase-like metal-dependent hydrolase (beta-lactamase superfamily II)
MHEWISLSKNVFLLTHVQETDRPSLGYIRGKKSALMIDAGCSFRHASVFGEKIGKENLPTPEFIVLTHWHWDHIFGLEALEGWVVSSEETKKYMTPLLEQDLAEELMRSNYTMKNEFTSEFDLGIRIPDITYKERLVIDLGGISALIQIVRCDHTSDCSVIFIPEEKILFLGDCLYNGFENGYPYLDRLTYLTLLNTLLRFPADIYIDSHRAPLTRKYLSEELKKVAYIADVTFTYPEKEEALDYLRADSKVEIDEEVLFYVEAFRNGEKRQKASNGNS